MEEYWTEQDGRDCATANTFEELGEILMGVARRASQPLGMVCGPISSGGLGSVAANLERFEKAIRYVRSSGIAVLHQLTLEKEIARMCSTPYYKDGLQLLNGVYRPVFDSELVPLRFFIPEWHTSFGARWEREQASRPGRWIFDIPLERLLG